MNAQITRLRITPNGRIQGLWSDDLHITELGPVRVRRASHVEFDDSQQCWCVLAPASGSRMRRLLQRLLGLRQKQVLHRAATRSTALDWEREHFGPGGRHWLPRIM